MDTVVSKIVKKNILSWQPGVQLFLRLSAWIGAPVLLAVAVGKYLDAKYRTDPWLFLFSVGIAFCVSTWAIIYYGLKEMKRIEQEFPKKNIHKQEDTSWQNNHQQ
jgi:hypothetical protein